MTSGVSPHLVVAACTYRRPEGLRRLLDALARQTFPPALAPAVLELLIVDNACSEETTRICAAFSRQHPAIPLRCSGEPRKGISYARNTVLRQVPAHCDLLALIDDDEVPDDTWLAALLSVQRNTGAAVVRGPVIPDYAPGTPAWVIRGGFYGWPVEPHGLKNGQPLKGGATNNVLLDWPAVRATGVHFDTVLAQTGGEDAVFFSQLKAHGLTIVFAARARVTEQVPAGRTSLAALLRLNYRLGANRLLKKQRLQPGRAGRARLIMIHLGKGLRHIFTGLYELLRTLLPGGGGRAGACVGLLDLARGGGHLAGLFGLRYRFYK